MIETLPALTPDAARVARTMAKCHGTLAARRRREEARSRRPSPRTFTAERLLLAGACVIYLISMAGNILRIVPAP